MPQKSNPSSQRLYPPSSSYPKPHQWNTTVGFWFPQPCTPSHSQWTTPFTMVKSHADSCRRPVCRAKTRTVGPISALWEWDQDENHHQARLDTRTQFGPNPPGSSGAGSRQMDGVTDRQTEIIFYIYCIYYILYKINNKRKKCGTTTTQISWNVLVTENATKRSEAKYFATETWSAVVERLARRTLDPRVVRSNPGRSVLFAGVPGQSTLPLIARVFSDWTLEIVGPFYLVSMPGEVYPTLVI